MIRQKKEESVKKIEEMLSTSSVVIATDYRGMSVGEMSKLRRQLRESGIEYHVIKNTMASLAAENAGREELKDLLKGPTAMAFGYGEVNEPARLLLEYIRTSRVPLSVKGGILSKRALTPEQVTMLSTLPPRPVLVAHLLRQMQSPISSLVAVLSAELTALARVLQARKQQLEGG
ncbi:MAG: 50S ribosomal protein L10 [Chloroflexi bacterium RBG_13_53_26]|nr:MAG: 50S ribosomal protein L10 [Chloroflexi bacterium RBG_13_53_26]